MEKNAPIRKGDVVVFKPEWQDPGDSEITFRVVEDEDGGRVRVVALVDLPIQPESIVHTYMIERKGG